ncbi:hypothetical protein [Pseudonocardia parietis]|uniref:HAMP domain-containing protein n=1 Tax=Pseudonocardia parietis TaxID=570936 RepID=A0ABS4VSA8_9PSEU|nr:hypothetical protein [Pseudonocardia parietis]MBP2366671.1 hypothetical protein [Pseudonocardia parietis]
MAARALLAALILIAGLAMASCGRASPRCDAAAASLDAGQVSTAAAEYARAARDGEGDCSDSGIAAVESHFSGAWRAVVDADAARAQGDGDAAAAAMRAAQELDQDNPAVIRWSGQGGAIPVLSVEAPDKAPEPATGEAPASGLIIALLITVLAVLGVMSAVVAGFLVVNRRKAPVPRGPPSTPPDTPDEELAALRRSLDSALEEIQESAKRAISTDGTVTFQLTEFETHLARVVDHLDKLLGEGTTHDRLVVDRGAE